MEEIGQSIRTRLRRINTCSGGIVEKFTKMCKELVEISKMPIDARKPAIQKIQHGPCLKIPHQTKDGSYRNYFPGKTFGILPKICDMGYGVHYIGYFQGLRTRDFRPDSLSCSNKIFFF